MIATIISIAAFGVGVVVGWLQRDLDKKRDTHNLAEKILEQSYKEPHLWRYK